MSDDGKRELTLGNIKDLDYGKLERAFEQHRRRAVEDCLDRPGDVKARKVTLTFGFKPVQDETGSCEEVAMQCEIQSKVPAHRTKVYECEPRKGGHLLFNAMSPEDIHQGTLPMDVIGDNEDDAE